MDSNQAYTLGLYEKAMPPGLSFVEMLQLTARTGFDRLEISIDETDQRLAHLDWSPRERRELLLNIADTNVAIKTLCLSGHRRFPLGSHDLAIRERSLDILKKAVNFAAEFGIAIIQLAGYDVYYEDHDEITTAFFEENLLKSVHYAASYGVVLAFETMETAFMDTVRKAMHYVGLVNSPYLGVYPDIGNLKNASVLYGHDLREDIQAGAGHTFAAHLKETVPGVFRDLDFGTGHTPYNDCIDVLWKMGVRLYTAEFWYDGKPDHEARIAHANGFIREQFSRVFRSYEMNLPQL